MKANAADAQRAFAVPGDVRLFLFHGPDESGSRALVRKLAEAMGEAAERVDLTGAELRDDPARLADEAAAISMFGDRRWILIEQAGDEITPAVEALLDAPVAGNPVAVVAGTMRAGSLLLKLALAAPGVLSVASFAPDGVAADKLVIERGRALGLDVSTGAARRIATDCGGNRAMIERELEKYALYLDAAPGAVRPLDHDSIDALGGSGGGEGALSRLVDSVADGDGATMEAELARLRGVGIGGIPLLRAMLRRMSLLARLRAEVEAGKPPAAVIASAGKAVFWKDRGTIQRQIGRWRADVIAKSIGRLLDAEREVMIGAGPIAADAELLAICRQAARLRP